MVWCQIGQQVPEGEALALVSRDGFSCCRCSLDVVLQLLCSGHKFTKTSSPPAELVHAQAFSFLPCVSESVLLSLRFASLVFALSLALWPFFLLED